MYRIRDIYNCSRKKMIFLRENGIIPGAIIDIDKKNSFIKINGKKIFLHKLFMKRIKIEKIGT